MLTIAGGIVLGVLLLIALPYLIAGIGWCVYIPFAVIKAMIRKPKPVFLYSRPESEDRAI